jgi:glycosyltransferase involved in cell wall biosynthesis
MADGCVAMTAWEASLMIAIYGADSSRLCVIPNGVEESFVSSPTLPRGPWLVCVATITAIKRQVELAEAAVQAQTPLWFVGRPFSETDAYTQRFMQLVQAHPELLRYQGPIEDRAELVRAYRSARGFVLLSRYESLSLSALEAAACQCPLLLSDLPWARTAFSSGASFCPISPATQHTADSLRRFYDTAPRLTPPAKPLTWLQVAERLKELYAGLLKRT